MDDPVVLPYVRSGAWIRPAGFRLHAHDAFLTLRRIAEVRAALSGLSDASREPDAYKAVAPMRLLGNELVYSELVILYSAMSVEGFLNDYGVKRLTEAYFSEHVERMPLFKKTRKLVALCLKVDLPEDGPLLVAVRNLSNARNDLVHPKTSESQAGDETNHGTALQRAESASRAAAEFFAEFSRLDDSVEYSKFW